MFALVAAISAICSRSPSDSDRVLRFRRLSRKLTSLAWTEGSTWGAGVIDIPRVNRFGCSALRIWSAETALSAASARPALIDNAVHRVIALSPENLLKLVIVLSSLLRLQGVWDAADTRTSQWRRM